MRGYQWRGGIMDVFLDLNHHCLRLVVLLKLVISKGVSTILDLLQIIDIVKGQRRGLLGDGRRRIAIG